MSQQTAVEWIINQLRQLAHDPSTHLGMGDVRVTQGMIDELEEQSKQMEKEQVELKYKDGTPMRIYNSPKLQEMVDLMNEPDTSSQTEISDEEIKKAWEDFRIENPNTVGGFQDQYKSFLYGIKWYREQIKSKQ